MADSEAGYGSVRSLGGGFAFTGRYAHPAQLDPAVLDHVSGGVDPQVVDEMSHATAAALLDRVHKSDDPEVVRRTLALIHTEGVDAIAELWAQSDADTLPGIMWRLYMLREWMRDERRLLARLWRDAEPTAGAASAVTGIDEAPTPEDIASTADSILVGAFTGDFAVALERSSVFCMVVARAIGAQKAEERPREDENNETPVTPGGQENLANDGVAKRLARTARDFHVAATLWRSGALY